jgi:hypothetical protein
MEFLKLLGLSEDQIKKASEGTPEEMQEIADKYKDSIKESVINNPANYKAIADKEKLGAIKVAEKKIAKVLGVTIEDTDNVDSLLEKGRKQLISNSELTAQELQTKLADAEGKLIQFEKETIPAIRLEEQSKVNQVYIDLALNTSASKLEKSILPIEDRILIGKSKLQSMGLELGYDNEKKVVVVKQKETGLLPQIGEKTYQLNDLDGVFSAVLEPYNQKSNGGGQNPPPVNGLPIQPQAGAGKVNALAEQRMKEIEAKIAQEH